MFSKFDVAAAQKNLLRGDFHFRMIETAFMWMDLARFNQGFYEHDPVQTGLGFYAASFGPA